MYCFLFWKIVCFWSGFHFEFLYKWFGPPWFQGPHSFSEEKMTWYKGNILFIFFIIVIINQTRNMYTIRWSCSKHFPNNIDKICLILWHESPVIVLPFTKYIFLFGFLSGIQHAFIFPDHSLQCIWLYCLQPIFSSHHPVQIAHRPIIPTVYTALSLPHT